MICEKPSCETEFATYEIEGVFAALKGKAKIPTKICTTGNCYNNSRRRVLQEYKKEDNIEIKKSSSSLLSLVVTILSMFLLV